MRGRGSASNNWRESAPNTTPMEGNPRDWKGGITKCNICESVMHWASKCPHSKKPANSTFLTHAPSMDPADPSSFYTYDEEFEVVLHQSDYDTPHHMDTLVAESIGCAVLDCGASKTVAGTPWWEMMYESLTPTQKQQCQFSPSNRYFKFGDGKKFKSNIQVNFPGKLGSKNIRIEADVINADIPLLFSKDSMKKAGMCINFKTDTVKFQDQELPLTVTKSGHYVIPVSQSARIIQNIARDKYSNVTLTMQSLNLSKNQIATKLHQQFAHAPAERVIKLLKQSGQPWDQDKELHQELQKLSNQCDTCARYRKPPSATNVEVAR